LVAGDGAVGRDVGDGPVDAVAVEGGGFVGNVGGVAVGLGGDEGDVAVEVVGGGVTGGGGGREGDVGGAGAGRGARGECGGRGHVEPSGNTASCGMMSRAPHSLARGAASHSLLPDWTGNKNG